MGATESLLLEQNISKWKDKCEEQSRIELNKIENEKNLLPEEKKKRDDEKKEL
jgi:actin-related protein